MKRYIQLIIKGLLNQAYYYYPMLVSLLGLMKLPFVSRQCTQVEIGAGPRKRTGFITLDCSIKCDVPWDLRLGLPFKDGRFDLIYAEHVLEHFDYADLCMLLQSAFRILKPGGLLKVSVPDVSLYVDALSASGAGFRTDLCPHKPALHYHTPIDYLNYMFYMNGEHRIMFDRNNIEAILRKCGASAVEVRAFDPTLDREVRRGESLLVCAHK